MSTVINTALNKVIKKVTNLLASAMFVLAPVLLSANSYADDNETQGILKLSYSDGRTVTTGLNKVNAVLTQVGFR